MRGDSRPLIAAILGLAAIGAIIAVMRLALPRLARHREQQLLGANYERVEAEGLEVWAPRKSNLAAWLARWFGAFTRALYEAHGKTLALEPVEDKIVVRVFATRAELVRFARKRMKQDLSHAGGFYDPASWSIALTLLPRERLLPVVFHEATHLVMDRSAPGGPPEWSTWLAEGMAVYMEHSVLRGERLVAGGVSRRAAAQVVALAAAGRHIPLRRLVNGGRELFRGPQAPLAYQEAGLLVAFLMTSRRYRDGFLRYYAIERKPGPAPPETLESCLGTTCEKLEKEWLAWLKGVGG